MNIADKVQTQNVKAWQSYGNSVPSVAQKLINARSNGRSGTILDRANIADWWIVKQDDRTMATYHKSELALQVPNRVEPKIPDAPELPAPRPYRRG